MLQAILTIVYQATDQRIATVVLGSMPAEQIPMWSHPIHDDQSLTETMETHMDTHRESHIKAVTNVLTQVHVLL